MKKLAPMIFIGILAALAAACGGKTAQPPTIKIGVNSEMTGLVSSFGVSSANGINLAIKEVNAQGGVLGKPLQPVFADNKSEPAEAALAATKLIAQDKVPVVLGPLISSTALACAKIAENSKIPMLTPSATNPAVTVQDGKTLAYVFRSCFIDDFMGALMANFAADSLRSKAAALYIDDSSDLAKSMGGIFEDSFVRKGGKIAAREAYLAKDTDFRATLTKIKGMGADVIFVPGNYQEVGMIVRQARELDLKQPIIGVDAWDSPKLFEIAGAEALNDTYYPGHCSPDDPNPAVQKFVKDYKDAWGIVPDVQAMLGYDAVLVLADAIKRAKSAEPEKIREALSATKNLQVLTGIITLDAKHNPIKGAVINENKDGKVIFKERIEP
jgi:branched-chain amino acid transport system substrate-binding protein